MFGTIRRHQSWLWIIIAGVTIISFVVYFGPNNNKLLSSLGGSQRSLGSISGQQVTRGQYEAARREVYLGYFLENNQWPDHTTELKPSFIEPREIYVRLFLVQKLQELGIEISPEAVVTRARMMLGAMSPTDFEEKILKPEGLSYDDFERYLSNYMGIQQLFMTAALSGTLVTPQEAETLYRNEHRDIATDAVFFSASNYLAAVSPTPADISQFYTNQLANYRIPARVEVSYIKYDVTNYLAAAKAALTNVDQVIDQNYSKYATNAESRATLKQDIYRTQAVRDAAKVANAFAVELDAMPAGTNRPGNLEVLAKKQGLTVQSTAPFDAEEGPQDIKVSPNFARTAFKLTQDDPFGGPISSEDGVYVMALKRALPSEIPPLKSIEAKVTKDYRTAKATQMAQQEAFKFDGALTNGLVKGKTFAAICAESKFKSESLPPFSLSTQTLPAELEDRIDIRYLKQAAFSTPAGKATRPIPARDGGFILYVEKQLPIDEAKLKKDLPNFIAYMRQARQNDAFNQWLGKQINNDPTFAQMLQKTVEDAQMKPRNPRLPKT